MAIHLEGSQTGQGFPFLKIILTRQGEDAGYLHVRFPEGIDAGRAGDRRHLKFYQDLRSPAWPAKLEAEPVELPVEWTGDEQDTGYTMKLDNGMVLRARAHIDGQRVVLSYELDNHTDVDMAGVLIWSCIQLMHAPELADHLMERTGVFVRDRFRLFRALVPGFEPYERGRAEYQRFGGHAMGRIPNLPNPDIKPHPGFPDDRTKDNRFWRSPEPIEREAIATLSRDGTWSVATVGRAVVSVWTNPGISCQHADPRGKPCKPGGTATVSNSVHIIESGVEELEGHLRALPEPKETD